MVTSHTEVEVKLDMPGATGDGSPAAPGVGQGEQSAEAGERLRALLDGGLPGVASLAAPELQELTATYFDTPDLRLARARTTLRRRTGGSDAGWHLKLPLPDGSREEISVPLGRAVRTVPKALASLVRVRVRQAPLGPVATVQSHRCVHRLLDAEGETLVEVSDDAVSTALAGELAAAHPDAGAQQWHEVEVELAGGSRQLLDAVVDALLDAGASRSSAPSKLARALGDLLPAAPPDAAGPPGPSSPAGDVVRAYLREQVDQLQLQDPRVRRDEEDSVHKMRVATRRLRSALATYRPLLDREVTEPLRGELKWLGGVLGRPRDAEVLHARLTALLEEQPAELVLGPVRRRLDAATQGEYRVGHRELLETLDGERYLGLLDALDALADDPPFTDAAGGTAKKVVRRRVHRTWKRVRSAARAAEEAPPAEREHLLHEVRKSAKRARYAGESVAGTFGSDAEDFAAAFEDLQEVLGELQDSVVTRGVLRQVGVQAHLDGENALTYGLLLGLELGRAERALAAYDPAWTAASAKSLRRWLR